jgi:hypothetical protein
MKGDIEINGKIYYYDFSMVTTRIKIDRVSDGEGNEINASHQEQYEARQIIDDYVRSKWD